MKMLSNDMSTGRAGWTQDLNKRTNMNETVSICLIGAGRAGQVHAKSILESVKGAELVAVVDSDASTRDTVSERCGARAFSSLEQALESLRFDAVVITTPTFTHESLTSQAVAAGRHVFCEKPMALDLGACDRMIEAAGRAGVLLQLGFMRRFDPEFTAAAARIEAGEIGRPMILKSLTHGPGLPPAWARDLNSHDWDTMRWLAHSDYQRIYAEVSNFKGEERGVTTDDFYDYCALAQIRFESGALGVISGVCPCEYGYDARVEIVGERGILQIGEMRGQAVVICTNRDQGLITPVYRTWPERFADAYVLEMRHFVECIRTHATPRVGGEDGKWAVAGVLAATQSFRENRPVMLEEIFGGVAAR
jgi:myo-inositol 2-dehydrogenase/D-chiro-inositol 1-dehydrogenase/scyllo-inositol 2-dehydrogenase (NAD+)